MPKINAAHKEHINLQLSVSAKRRIERAASVEGKTVQEATVLSGALCSDWSVGG